MLYHVYPEPPFFYHLSMHNKCCTFSAAPSLLNHLSRIIHVVQSCTFHLSCTISDVPLVLYTAPALKSLLHRPALNCCSFSGLIISINSDSIFFLGGNSALDLIIILNHAEYGRLHKNSALQLIFCYRYSVGIFSGPWFPFTALF